MTARPEGPLSERVEADAFTARAVELIQDQLLNHPDPGVRAIAAISEPPADSVARVAAALRARKL